MKKIIAEFKQHWPNYVIQSLLATFFVFLILHVLSMRRLVIVASLGATSFIVFAMPNTLSAKPRNIIGGYIVGLVCGALFCFIPHPAFVPPAIYYAAAVGLSIFLMVAVDTEHPPASGVALAVALGGASWKLSLAIIGSAVMLSLIHELFKKQIRDLT
ncbi:MAG: HPP family protein [Candidatus Saganbacteria bacterium]|nr:HPP family protein [Candidatus Saganbacteria bacterium]